MIMTLTKSDKNNNYMVLKQTMSGTQIDTFRTHAQSMIGRNNAKEEFC